MLRWNEAKRAAGHLAGTNVADSRRKGHPGGGGFRDGEPWLLDAVTFARLLPMRQAAVLQGGQM